MLTDEDLIRELEAGFREASAGLTYAGNVPIPRRTSVVPWTAVPIAAATAAVVVLPQLGGGGTPTAGPARPGAVQTVVPQVDATLDGHPGGKAGPGRLRLVTRSFDVLGRTFHYQAAADEPVHYILFHLGAEVPADATPISDAVDIDEAWVGTDPKTGDAAAWWVSRKYFGDEVVEMSSPFFTQEQFTEMLQTPPDQQ
jgi:hypothetical protein